jgi:hypothetical protein
MGWLRGIMTRFQRVFLGRDAWLTGYTPLAPKEPLGEAPRRLQYPPGYNIQIQPRANQAITFPQLRNLADSCDLVRIVLERLKNAIIADEWDIVPREDDQTVPEFVITKMKQFWDKPDKRHQWDEWLSMVLEEVLVIDALSVYVNRTRGGSVHGFDIVDGATIKPLIDSYGYEPDPPTPAYQQFLYGVPYVALTKEELCYRPKNRRANSLYGFSPIEQIVLTVNMAIRRWLYNLNQFNEGNVPTGTMSMPENWGAEEIEKFQTLWDAMLAGDPKLRSRVRMVPHGSELKKFKDDEVFGLHNAFDEWMARIICYAFGVDYSSFVAQSNRSSAETSERKEQEQGLAGYRLYLQRLVNKLIWEHMGEGRVKFKWITDHSYDAKLKIQRNVSYVQAGIYLVDEVRSEEGKMPIAQAAKEYGVEVPAPGGAVAARGIAQPRHGISPNSEEPARPHTDLEESGEEDRLEEMDRFERKMLKDAKAGRKSYRAFENEYIPDAMIASIMGDLKKGPMTVEYVKDVFGKYR